MDNIPNVTIDGSNGNGHKPELTPEIKKFLNTGTFDGAFTTPQMSQAIDKFVERGDKTEDLILRSEFPDYDTMIAWNILFRKAKQYGDSGFEEFLMNYAASVPAIGGKRIAILLDAVIGQHQQEQKKSGSNWFKRVMGMGVDNSGNK